MALDAFKNYELGLSNISEGNAVFRCVIEGCIEIEMYTMQIILAKPE